MEYLFPCLTPRNSSRIRLRNQPLISEKQTLIYSAFTSPTNEEDDFRAAQLVAQLFAAEKPDDISNIVLPQSWSSRLAEAVLARLQKQIKDGASMGDAFRATFDRALQEAKSFAEEHPVLAAVLATVVVLAILAVVFPWALEALGFAELGPVGGELFLLSFFPCTTFFP